MQKNSAMYEEEQFYAYEQPLPIEQVNKRDYAQVHRSLPMMMRFQNTIYEDYFVYDYVTNEICMYSSPVVRILNDSEQIKAHIHTIAPLSQSVVLELRKKRQKQMELFASFSQEEKYDTCFLIMVESIPQKNSIYEGSIVRSTPLLLSKDGRIAMELFLVGAVNARYVAGKAGIVMMLSKGRKAFVYKKSQERWVSYNLEYSMTDLQIMIKLSHGLSAESVAKDLCMSVHTVRDHIKKLYARFYVNSTIELITVVHQLQLF